MNPKVQENFDSGGWSTGWDNSWNKHATDVVQDSSSLTSQFKCLKSKRFSDYFGYTATSGKLQGETDRKSGSNEDEEQEGGGVIQSSREEKENEFSPLSLIWIVLPLINLCAEIAMDFIGIILFFIKEIFMMTYNMIVPSFDGLFGQNTGCSNGIKKYCFKYDFIRHVVLILCPPAAIFMADGLRGWLQILICAAATLLYYFPGLAYAIIVVNRSEVNSYMKQKQNPGACDDNAGLGNFFVSDKDNMATCKRDVGDTCTVGSEDTQEKSDCCANPVLEGGVWKRLGKIATDPDGNPISKFQQGEVYCRNDTKKVKIKKGICVWKSTNQPT